MRLLFCQNEGVVFKDMKTSIKCPPFDQACFALGGEAEKCWPENFPTAEMGCWPSELLAKI
jgi:hypothetical protein